jgi:hypothetical protein
MMRSDPDRARLRTKEHRDRWKQLGYRSVTLLAHDNDRYIVLAFAEVMKYERTLRAVKRGDQAVIDFLVGRNYPRRHDNTVVTELVERVEKLPNKDEIMKHIRAANNYNKLYVGHMDLLQADPTDDKVAALTMAYAYLYKKSMDYALALAYLR